jgi:hypothetical protein
MIDDPVHPPGLFRGQVGQRPLQHARRHRLLRLQGQARRDAEVDERNGLRGRIDQDVVGREVLFVIYRR